MATMQEVEAAKQAARDIAKDFPTAEDKQLGFASLYTWVYEPKCYSNPTVLEGDFTDAQRDEILGAGAELLPE